MTEQKNTYEYDPVRAIRFDDIDFTKHHSWQGGSAPKTAHTRLNSILGHHLNVTHVGDLDNFYISEDVKDLYRVQTTNTWVHKDRVTGIKQILIETLRKGLSSVGYEIAVQTDPKKDPSYDKRQEAAQKLKEWRENQNQSKSMKGFCADDFEAVSSYGDDGGWVSIQFKVCDDFANAINLGHIPFMLKSNPTELDWDVECPITDNAKSVARAIGGYECHFDPQKQILDVAFDTNNLHATANGNVPHALADACFKLMPKP